MKVSHAKEKNITIVKVEGRLDAISAPELDKYLSEFVFEDEYHVLMDFVGLGYISSAGLRSVLSCSKRLKEKKRKILFYGVNGPVEEVFRISGFASMFIFLNDDAYNEVLSTGNWTE